jgi:zinc protease
MTHRDTPIIHRYLPNGMEIYLERRTSAPLVTAHAWVKVGSCDETPDESGLSHLLEHMLFKGTENYPASGLLAKTVENAGGDINAYTRHQETVYHITAPNSFSITAISLLFEMLFRSTLDSDELERERTVVLDEESRCRDSPGNLAAMALYASMYAGTPLERPIIGSREVIVSCSREKLREFYRRWYVPNNMVLIVIGDFNPEELYETITKLAESVLPRSIPERHQACSIPCGPLAQPISLIKGEWQEVRAHLALPTPPLEGEEFVAWSILASILGNGDTSRLSRNVHESKGLVGAIGASLSAPRRLFGLLTISLYCEEEKTLDAFSATIDELHFLAEEGPTTAEMERVVYTTIASRIFDSENLETKADNIGFALSTRSRLRFEDEYLDAMRRLTAADIQRVAKRAVQLLREKRYAMTLAVTNSSTLSEANLAWNITVSLPDGNETRDEKRPDAIRQTIISTHNPDVRQIVLPLPGDRTLRVNVRENRETPIASAVLATRGGGCCEPLEQTGISHLASQMLTRGNERLSFQAISEELENRAATLGAFAGADSIGMQLVALEEHVPTLYRTFLESFFAPSFAADQWERIQSDTLLAITAGRDNPARVMQELLAERLFGNHPYGRTLSRYEHSVAALQREQALAHWNHILASHSFVLSLTGSLPVERIIDETVAAFTRFYESHPEKPPVTPQFETPLELEQITCPRLGHHCLDRQQAHFALAYRTVPIHDGRRLAFDLAASILSGQGGRLFLDLRDTRGLAYMVGADHQQYALAGAFSAYMATAPEHVEEGLRGIREHLNRLATDAPSTEELERARNLLIAARAIDAQHVAFQARQLVASHLHNLPFDYFLTYNERISAVTADDVRDAMRGMLASTEPVLVFVGPDGMWLPE